MATKKKQYTRVILVNGPNLGLLGTRQPELYGSATLQEIESRLSATCSAQGTHLDAMQSNSEGKIIDFLNASYAELKQAEPRKNQDQKLKLKSKLNLIGLIINPGGLTHTSIALRDAVEMFKHESIPILEVHLSNIHSREPFRNVSLISAVASGVVCGLGAKGYEIALDFILQRALDRQQ
jgi:3-dehydroquinate dehydratase-2